MVVVISLLCQVVQVVGDEQEEGKVNGECEGAPAVVCFGIHAVHLVVK